MSANAANKEAAWQENPELYVRDKRRFSPDGEPIEGEVVEPEATAGTNADTTELELRLKEAEEKRAEAERQVRDFSERFKSAQAQLKSENEEMRARMNRTFEQKLETARGDLVAGLLDTLDNLKRAVASAEAKTDFNTLLEGVRATVGLFESKMQSLGLNAIESVGQDFNPEIHEAVETVAVPAEQDHKVIGEFQTGYKFGDRLLRPARVRVGRAE